MSQQAPPIQLIASGDSRLPANRLCWPAQQRMEAQLGEAVRSLGFTIERAHPETADGHGFIDSQKRGLEVFRGIAPGAPLIVAEAVWQYTHHVLAGLDQLGHHLAPHLADTEQRDELSRAIPDTVLALASRERA